MPNIERMQLFEANGQVCLFTHFQLEPTKKLPFSFYYDIIFLLPVDLFISVLLTWDEYLCPELLTFVAKLELTLFTNKQTKKEKEIPKTLTSLM